MIAKRALGISAVAAAGIACAAITFAQGPKDKDHKFEEERTQFGIGAKHPLTAPLPSDHPLAKGPGKGKEHKEFDLPDKPGAGIPDSDEAWTEVEYDAATKKEKRGVSAKKRPSINVMPKHSFGMDKRILLDPSKQRQRTVFEGDRKLVANTTFYPWRTSCKLYMKFPGGSYIGSGVMIGRKYVLTAGHCVYYAPAGGWATSIEVIPGYVGTTNYKPYGSAYMSTCQSFTGWTVNGNYEHDIAIIKLDRNIGYSSGWLSYWNWASNVGSLMYTSGYPSDLSFGLLQYWDNDNVNSENTNVVRYKADTYKGQSGSGVWRYSSSVPYVIAVHANGFSTTNVGTRLNGSRISSFNAFMAANP